ncbi:MAG: hypothetical protein ACTHJV_12435, partial [Rhizobiaceae bacterium]
MSESDSETPTPNPPQRKTSFADVGMRTLSAVVLAAIAVAATWMGGAAFRLLTVLGSALIFVE